MEPLFRKIRLSIAIGRERDECGTMGSYPDRIRDHHPMVEVCRCEGASGYSPTTHEVHVRLGPVHGFQSCFTFVRIVYPDRYAFRDRVHLSVNTRCMQN